MKKVKTILSAIFMILATAFISACSCTDGDITQVYETGISIRCTTDATYWTKDEESGDLTIRCYKNDRFTIEYTLTPPGVTTTQVDWEFSDNSGILSASSFSYSKSATEQITFTASNRGETTITFTTKATGKKVKAYVTVSEEKSKLPTLDAPSGFDYNPSTGTISWDHVTTVKLNGNTTRAEIVDGKAKGLVAYKVTVSEYSYDKGGNKYIDSETTKTEEVVSNQYTGLEAGKTYAISVSAVGNDYDAKSGEASLDFFFHQLSKVTNLSNNNGEITFTAPKFSPKSILTCEGSGVTVSKTQTYPSSTHISEMGGNDYSAKYTEFGSHSDYTISVVAYPRDYIEARGYAEIDGVRYYPSVPSETVSIKKLSEPEISLENVTKDNVTIGGATFNGVSSSTRLKLLGKEGEGITASHKVKYQYFVLSREVNSSDYNYIDKIAIDKVGSFSIGANSVSVCITSDPAVDIETMGGVNNTVFVRMIGDLATTISSDWSSFEYKKLGKVYNSNKDENTGITETGEEGFDIPTWSISDNVISIIADNAGCVEFYFVNIEDATLSKSVLVENTSYDITGAQLVPGAYKIYARLVGEYTLGVKTLTGKISNNPLSYCNVLSTPLDSSISSKGVIKFKTVYEDAGDKENTEINNYTIYLTKDNATQSVTLKKGVVLDDVVDGDYIVPLGESDSNGYRTFSLYDVIRVILSRVDNRTPSDITDAMINSYLEAEGSYSFKLVANSNVKGAKVTISSPSTASVNFTRVANIADIQLLGSNSLKFVSVSDKYVVKIITSDGDKVSEETQGSLEGEYVTINLAGLKINDGSGDSILDYVGDEGTVGFKIYAVGATGSTGILGKIDSIETEIYFNCSAVPTSISLSANGILTWLSTTGRTDSEPIGSDDATYQLTFYIDGKLSSVDTKFTEQSKGTPSADRYSYSYDISSILAKYEGKIVGVKILELVSSKFAGKSSDAFYAVKLNTANLERGTTANSEPVIKWSAVNLATGYKLTCDKNIFEGGSDKVDNLDIPASGTLQYLIPADLAEGSYLFNLVAYGSNSNTAGYSIDNPYIISSSSEQTGDNNPNVEITVVNGKLMASAMDDKVTWSIIAGADYGVRYHKDEGSDTTWKTVDPEDIQTLTNLDKKYVSFAGKDAGKYTIEITPTVDFVESGVILKEAGSLSSITKLASVEFASITTSSGLLKFPYATDKEYSIQLYSVSGEDKTLIPSNLYTDTLNEGNHLINLFGLSSGEVNIAIGVTFSGSVDSDISEAYAVNKLSNVTEFAKVGDYLQWKPVEVGSIYATGYEILLDNNYKTSLKVSKNGSDYVCYVLVDEGGIISGGDTPASADLFDFTDGVFKFKPDAITEAGQYDYKITAIISTTGYLNSNAVSTKVTKLHNLVTIEVGESGVFEYGAYEAIENNEPSQVVIKVGKVTVVTPEEGEENPSAGEGYEFGADVHTITMAFTEYASLTSEGNYTIDISTLGIASFDEDGVYGTTIQFIGNGGSVMSSEVSTVYTFDKLPTTTAVSSKSGALTWTSVETAEKYSVEIKDSTSTIVATFDYTLSGTEVSIPSTITDGEGGVSNLKVLSTEVAPVDPDDGEDIESQGLDSSTTFTYICDEIYSVRVMARKAGALNSKWSIAFSFKKLKALKNLTISRTDSVIRDDGTVVSMGVPALYWENPNLESAELQVNYEKEDGSIETSVDPFPSSEKQYFELASNIPVGSYNIRMQVIGNTNAVFGLLSSDLSDISSEAKINFISNMTAPEVTQGKLTWSSLPSAYSYKVKFTNILGTSYEVYKNGTELDLNDGTLSGILTDRLGNGYWTVKVLAVTDPKIGIVSEDADAVHTDTLKVFRPNAVGNYKVKDGMLSWTISYTELALYMAGVELPEEPDVDEGDEEEVTPASEKMAIDISTFVPYLIDMATKGESAYEETYGSISLEHFYKVKLNINGVDTTDKPTDAVVLNSRGEVVQDYKSGDRIEFTYDVSIHTDFNTDEDADPDDVVTSVTNSAGIEYSAGYYEIYVSPVGDSKNVLDGAKTGTLTAYKLSTPKSWYDSVTTQVPRVDEDGNPIEDEDGNQIYDTITSKNDIARGKALWELSVINAVDDGETSPYHKDYTLRAVTKDSETRVSASVTVGDLTGADKDPNVYDNYKYSRDIKDLFYGDDEDNRVALDTRYRLFILANGTKDSTLQEEGEVAYLNSNNYMFSDTMTILTTDVPEVTNGQLTWDYNTNSTSTKLRIYGPLNIQDGELKEDETAGEWSKQTMVTEELAKLRYLDGVDESEAFKGISPSKKATLISEVESNRLQYEKRIKVVDLSSQDGARANQYTFTDNASFPTGGYAIYKQEIGDNRGVIDSPESDKVYAYKLGTTSATRQIDQRIEFGNGSSYVKKVDYWLGQNDLAGVFVWKPVPYANAYKLTLKATNVDVDGEENAIAEVVKRDILVVGQTYYEPDSDVELNKKGYKYSLDIVATNVENTGSNDVPSYEISKGYFNSDTTATDQKAIFISPTDATETATITTGRYYRLDIPTSIVIDDTGKIAWNKGVVYNSIINNYAIAYQFSGKTAISATTDNTPSIAILNTVLGSISIEVKAIAIADCGYINSSYSTPIGVTKIAPPVPRVNEGVFEWGTEGDEQAGQSVTASVLTIDGTKVDLQDNSILSYSYFTDITLDNQEGYSAKIDEQTYSVGKHDISIMYKGTQGSSDDAENIGKQFYLASEQKKFYVTKLSTPVLQNVINQNANEENRISWNTISDASAYRLKFFIADVEYSYTIIKDSGNTYSIRISDPNLVDDVVFSDLDGSNNDYFEANEDEIKFKLNALLKNINVSDTDSGLKVYAFVQAIGNLKTGSYNAETGLWETISKVDPNDDSKVIEIGSQDDYRATISSSYSDRLVVAIPSAPTNGQYDPSTGVLTWSMTNVDDIYVGYNIIINIEYQISEVSSSQKDTWFKSAHKTGTVSEEVANFAGTTTNEDFDEEYLYYDEIKERQVVSYYHTFRQTYTLYVRDTVLVMAYRGTDKNGTERTITPTSYNVKTVASNYTFALIATAYDSTNTSSNSYKSTTYNFSPKGSFSLFYSGNGSPEIPYVIHNETQLNHIRNYPDSHYKLSSDIVMSEKWEMIDTFTGTIDGTGLFGLGKYTISNLSVEAKANDDKTTYVAFILNNKGTIKNVNFQVQYEIEDTSSKAEYQIAGVVINNTGTLNNVNIVTKYTYNEDNTIDYNSSKPSVIDIKAITTDGIYVGGLVLDNKGTISNSSVMANITVLDDGATNKSTVIGGIARKVSGESSVISECRILGEKDSDGNMFSGTYTANNIGGIVDTIEGATTISKCYVDYDVILYVTDRSANAGGGVYRGGQVGGIVDSIKVSNVTIDTCYSLARVIVDARSSGGKDISIGGLIGDKNSTYTNVTLSNSYAYARYTYASGSGNTNIYAYGINGSSSTGYNLSGVYYIQDYVGSSRVTLMSGIGTEANDVDDLKEKMSTLGYDVSGDYPTIK